MNNLRTVTPKPRPSAGRLRHTGRALRLIGFLTAAIGLYLFLPAPVGLGVLNMWLALPLIIVLTLGFLRILPGKSSGGINASSRSSRTSTPGP
jgi:MFS transporter, NNP family, nitrate/nitrite transporter